MKKLLLILTFVPLIGLTQTIYSVDTLAIDSITTNPTIIGIAKLTAYASNPIPSYSVDINGVNINITYLILSVNAGIIYTYRSSVYLPKTEYPGIWTILTSSTIKNSINSVMQNYFDDNIINWNQYFQITNDTIN